MQLLRLFIAALLILESAQALALFMPDGVSSDKPVISNDVGC